MAAAVAAASTLLPAGFPFLFGGTPAASVSNLPNTSNATFPFLLPQFVTPQALLPNMETLPTEIREKLQTEMKQRIQQLQLNSSILAAPTLINNGNELNLLCIAPIKRRKSFSLLQKLKDFSLFLAVQAPPTLTASPKLSSVAEIVSSQRELLRKQAVELKEQVQNEMKYPFFTKKTPYLLLPRLKLLRLCSI